MANSSLQNAKAAKNDEFYTRFDDIQKELNYYRDQFKNKVVYCNCDDPGESEFCRFFQLNFDHFGLKKLICTHYTRSDLFNWLEDRRKGYVLEITGKDKVKKTFLTGNGDFRSPECVELLKQCDIVCTNPPFSLFREYIHQLIYYKKKFLVIGNKNAIAYKEIFPLFQHNKIWIGYTAPDDFICLNGELSGKMKGLTKWWTNLDITKRHEKMILYEEYTAKKYPTYVNYPAIEVSKSTAIPKDYYGIMGVPISFIDKFSPEQFEIIGLSLFDATEKPPNLPPALRGGPACYLLKNGQYKRLYNRIFIKRKDIQWRLHAKLSKSETFLTATKIKIGTASSGTVVS